MTWDNLIAKGHLAVEGSRLISTAKGAALDCGPDADGAECEARASAGATRDLARG